MTNIINITLFEIKSLLRESTVYSIALVFLLMSAASSFIGWSTFTTANAIYKSSTLYSQAILGVSEIPVNPLLKLSSLASFDNLIIYFSLIGTLLAIIIGHRSMMRERKSGIIQILFTRPIKKHEIVVGKVLGLSLTVFSVISFTAIVSILSSFLLPLTQLNFSDMLHLTVFFSISFLYMMFFTLVGLLFAIRSKSESLALFIPICIWVAITFVLPELSTGLTPTALLNPVTLLQLPATDTFFQNIEKLIQPFSLAWHYYTISGQLLGSTFTKSVPIWEVLSKNITQILTLIIGIFSLIYLSFKSLNKFDTRSDFINE